MSTLRPLRTEPTQDSGATSALCEVLAYLNEVATADRGQSWERASRAVRGLERVVRGEMAVTRICKECWSRFTLTAEEVLFFSGKVRPDGTKWKLPRRCALCRRSRG
jgi:hypothetical protein